ncbi:unnamed protein product [Cercopithifilaria johnstoni]|uniref:Uncharacterized protein n=1 Tax=Cercopithifilaria johnstoni TaxID=2874296 RepID=A0A8J2LYH5_9BILA|nr:unnamed protein product [Cercopithifilaria johnstoni]
MSASEVAATHNLVFAGITDSGAIIINGVMLDSYHLSTSLSFHHIESVTKFTAEETSPEREQATDESGITAGAPAVTPVFQGGSMSEETISATEQWENHTMTAGLDPRIQAQLERKHEQDNDMMEPIALSGPFERKRTSSLVAALLSGDREPGYKAYVQFVSPSGVAQVIEACDNEEEFDGMERSVESVVGRLLFTLSSLKMSDPDRHAAAIHRLQDLEEELRAAGAVCPPDTTASNAISKMLASASPTSDIQIRINSSQYITTTKSVFETETPGMEGLDAATVQHLQQQLISNMSVPETPLSSEPSAPTVTDQKHETMAEGFTNEDGSAVVSKKMTRVVTTTRTTLPGDLIRLKVNEQVYSGSVDPGDQHIHLVPITKQQQKLDSIEQQQQQERQ